MSEQIQGSPAWIAARLGKLTASRIGDAIARTKTGPAAVRTAYMAELMVERLTGQPAPVYVTPAMQWGTDVEPQARAAYEWIGDCEIVSAGFVEHPHITMSGCSPDGLVGDDGMVEFKCPTTATHLETLLSGQVPAKHLPQIMWQMACTGRTWCDFVSYDPRLPELMRFFKQRVLRDEVAIAELERQAVEFLSELDAKIEQLRETYERPVMVIEPAITKGGAHRRAVNGNALHA